MSSVNPLSRKAIALLTLTSLLGTIPPALQAQIQVAVGPKASTLGLGGELIVQLAPAIALRGGAQFLSFTRNETLEGIDYEITPKLRNGNAFLDLHPFEGSFRLTGGVVLNENRVDLVATSNGPVEIGNLIFQPAELGRLDGRITVQKVSPYLGLGFAGRGRVALSVDFGVVFHGTPQASLVGTTPLTGPARTVFDSEVARELADVQQAINNEQYAKYYPVLAFGLLFRM